LSTPLAPTSPPHECNEKISQYAPEMFRKEKISIPFKGVELFSYNYHLPPPLPYSHPTGHNRLNPTKNPYPSALSGRDFGSGFRQHYKTNAQGVHN